MNGELETRLAAMEQRLKAVEDELAITRLLTAYGPLVDRGVPGPVGDLFTEAGVYDVDSLFMDGREAVEQMVESPAHQGFVAGGSAHVSLPAHVAVDGDRATAVCYSMLVLHRDGRFHLVRTAANRWELLRDGDSRFGWRIARRTTRVLDGGPAARELLDLQQSPGGGLTGE